MRAERLHHRLTVPIDSYEEHDKYVFHFHDCERDDIIQLRRSRC